MTDALIERLEFTAADIKSSRVGLPSYDSQLMAEAAQALKAKDAEIAELREALKPFADVANRLPEIVADDDSLQIAVFEILIKAGAFRAARKVLGGSDGE